jgi:hypothetical protein
MLKQRKTENPMGAGKKQALRVTFDSRLKQFHHVFGFLLRNRRLACHISEHDACKPVEQEENQEKGPRRSWA